MGTLNPTIARRPAFTAEVAEDAEKPVTLFCNDEKHGLGTDGFCRRMVFSACSAVSAVAMCKISVEYSIFAPSAVE